MLRYFSQAGPLHPKHGGGDASATSPHESDVLPPLHPSLVFLVHYSVAIPSVLCVHDAFFPSDAEDHRLHPALPEEESAAQRQTAISNFLSVYTLILFSARYLSSCRAGRLRHHSVLYEFTWLCNSTLLTSALSLGGRDHRGWLFRRRPLVAAACCTAVSVDQVLWYVDLLGRALCGKFPVGVMKYLTWEQTLWIDRFTCTHHLWTIPIVLYGASDAALGWDTFGLSVCVVVIHVLLSRWLTPPYIQSRSPRTNDDEKRKDPQHYRYLNVNLSHELWRDISLPFLQISTDNPPSWVYLLRLLWRWQLFNGLIFVAVLRPLSRLLIL